MPVGDPSPPTDDPLIGKVLSERYRIVRKIGEGGMGAVYQAEHALIEKKIALKILFQDLTRRPDLIAALPAGGQERVAHRPRERHRHLRLRPVARGPGVHRDGVPRRPGPREDAEDRPAPWTGTRARPILMQIAKGLRAAHGNGIIHRDMKPENVYLIQREGRPDFVKVLDFGIAKIINADEGRRRR